MNDTPTKKIVIIAGPNGAGKTTFSTEFAAAGRNFAFETTLAGHTYATRISKWRSTGYAVKLIFQRFARLRKPSPESPYV